ncbi:MAG: FHIPEP family type III secretion protein [Candidatus Bipolaricaulia bacterium]
MDVEQRKVVIVTQADDIRPFVRRLIELEFPRVLVLLLNELHPDLRDDISRTIEYSSNIEDTPAVMQHTSEGEGIEWTHTDENIAETPAPPLHPQWLEIKMHPNYLKQLFNVGQMDEPISVHAPEMDSKVRELFGMMADGLFYELGIRVPDIRLIASQDIDENAFAVKVDHTVDSPHTGLQPHELLVNDIPERLELLGVEASMAINPANDTECSIINEKDQWIVEAAGLYTWDPVGYMILALSREIRRNAWHLLDVETAEYELAQLHEYFPELVMATLETVSSKHLTQVLRELLSEQISVRDLRTILERVLTYDYIVTDPSRYIVFDDRLAIHERLNLGRLDDVNNYAQHVRMGLKPYISHKYTYGRGQDTLIVYLLDPQEIEDRILDHLAFERGNTEKSPLKPEEIEEIKAAVRSEFDFLPPTAASPIILTLSAVRSFMHKMLAAEFPDLSMLSYDELSPDINIQPIARISL